MPRVERPDLIAIVGPTGSGKTAVAVALARHLDVEVVSADSRQVRAEMHIGTAAPTDAERSAVRHHLVGVVAPDEPYTLVDWLRAARAAIEEIRQRGRVPLLVGGTGQYVRALLDGWVVPEVPPDHELRGALERLAAEQGREALHERLAAVDPASAARIDARNVRRVIRALEVIEATGRPIPPLEEREAAFTWRCFGLHWRREALYDRVDRRVEVMFAEGLVEETRTLVDRHGRAFRALRTIGYEEALGVIDGAWSVEEAIERARLATHRLVRTQANWFAAGDPRIEWIDGRDAEAAALVIAAAVGGRGVARPGSGR
jgi:tRNA dimethylallyltransferase